MMPEQDLYALLGVDPKAPPEVIRAAYHALARKYHPDTNPGTSKLGTQFQKVASAYELLSDPVRRAAYDVERNTARAWQVPPPPPHPYWTTERTAQPPPSYAPPQPRATHAGVATATTTKPTEATIGRRVVAFVIDSLILAGVVLLYTVGLVAVGAASGNPRFDQTDAAGGLYSVFAILVFFGPPLYWLIGWAISGRTIGARCVGIRVVRRGGEALGVRRALLRLFGGFLSLLPLGLGLWWAAWDPRSSTWYDRMADAEVRRT